MTTPANSPGLTPSRRKAHRRGAGRALAPTGLAHAPDATRQCMACRTARPVHDLLQLRDVAPGAAKGKNRHTYACVDRACFLKVGQRLGTGVQGAEAFVAQLAELATARLTGVIGLARRQGILVLGAARIVDARPAKQDAFAGAELDGADFDIDADDDDDDDWDDDADADDDHDNDAGHIDVSPQGAHAGPKLRRRKAPGKDVVMVACDAAARTARQVGDEGRPCMLTSEAMGHAAGGVPVAAVAIPQGRLALQAVYWLQVWYEARSRVVGDARAMTVQSQRSIEVA